MTRPDFPRPRGAERPDVAPIPFDSSEPAPVLYSVDDLIEEPEPRPIPGGPALVALAVLVAFVVLGAAGFVMLVHYLYTGSPW